MIPTSALPPQIPSIPCLPPNGNRSFSIISSSLHHSTFSAGTLRRPAGPLLPTRPRVVVLASKGGDYGGSLVDQNMIVLRKRIHEMKLAERNYEPPSHWMDWEKECYTSYGSGVCELVGLLQALLMSTRPSVAIGAMALLAFSVPTCWVLILFHVC